MACKNDQDDIVADILKEPDSFNINHTDGIGNTALHYATKFGSLNCLDLLVEHNDIDVNIKNRLEEDTPLHLAIAYKDDPDVALAIIESLLDCKADPRIQNKNRLMPLQLVDSTNKELRDLLQQVIAGYQVDRHDIANDDDDNNDDDDGPSDEE
ncbi:ankyrin repeat-containing domain protein [Jimgerdemannia flammicorona]|uniref:Ankyrin repeat-containing domain protein n=1 Tax=Jimgerdemannia flammicorona TaxID=994334 RepID=A0A433A2F9_9FUNG|nr:ankyrin repeat-containing domain protein [Jimgerdemannia flammicorona]